MNENYLIAWLCGYAHFSMAAGRRALGNSWALASHISLAHCKGTQWRNANALPCNKDIILRNQDWDAECTWPHRADDGPREALEEKKIYFLKK
jgi:hypothetical protein